MIFHSIQIQNKAKNFQFEIPYQPGIKESRLTKKF